jgi:glucosamine kinase
MTMGTAAELILGVDGGQSSTRTLLATSSGEILGAARTGPANHIHEAGGLERQYESLKQGYLGAFAAAGLKPRRVACAFLGVTGSGHLPTVERAVAAEALLLRGDHVTAFAGALPELVGVVLIAGTGSIAYGRDEQGGEHRTGGWGYFAADEGSGYDLARQAFRAVYRAYDGRGPSTLLTELLLEQYDCADLAALRKELYAGTLGRDRLAEAAATVATAERRGDRVAEVILRRAAADLAELVVGIVDRLEFADSPIAVAPVGGVFEAGDAIRQPLLSSIRERHPKAYLREPRLSPAKGALVLALRELGRKVDQTVMNRLESDEFSWSDLRPRRAGNQASGA